MAIKLLHTADWQLGKPFTRFADGDVAVHLRDARLAAVERIAALAAAEDVAAVLVAGDVLESEHSEPGLLRRMVHRMAAFPGPWLLLPGNHDPARLGGVWDQFRQSGDCPANVHVLTEPQPLALADGRLVVLPAPLTQKHVTGDPTMWFETAEVPAGAVKVGLAHGAVREFLHDAAESPNPIALDRAERAGLDYLALGDWHSVLRITPQTWYCGTPEPDRFTKSGIGEVLLVSIAGPGSTVSVEQRRIGRLEWREVALDLGQAPDAAVIQDQFQALLATLATPADTVLRLTLEGGLDLAGWAGLGGALERLGERLRHLEEETGALATAASDADLAALATEPLLAEVADALGRSTDPAALHALRLLHGTWQRLEPG
jgi:DNA repair exonuclease SbcCD nuclease subunit